MSTQRVEISEDSILVFANDQIERVAVPSGKVTPWTDPFEDLAVFSGLTADEKTATSTAQSNIFVRADEGRYAYVVWSKFEGDPADAPFEPTVLESKYFVCDAVRRSCEEANYFNELRPKVVNAWIRWNRTSRLLAGHASGEGVGNSTPVVIATLPDAARDMRVASTTYGLFEARVPNGNFSPSLKQFVIQIDEHTSTSTALELFNASDPTRPLARIPIQSILDASVDYTVRSLAWSPDETQIAIGMQKQIYVYDLRTRQFTLLFDDTTPTSSGVDWEWNELKFTKSGRYLVFQDLLAVNPGGNGYQSVLRAIDMKTKKIINLAPNKMLVWW